MRYSINIEKGNQGNLLKANAMRGLTPSKGGWEISSGSRTGLSLLTAF
ncbi:MAG: hypothetical protein ACOYUZ_02270 [Patescibacteria group bacterium]